MHRFYLPPEQITGKVIALRESDSHHAFKVLRLQTDDPVVVLDGAGVTYYCRIKSTSKREVTLRVVEKQEAPRRTSEVTLFQAIPKAKLMDGIIQKATELGVFRIVPLLTERVATQLNPGEAEDKAEKYRVVAVEAIKQSGNPWLPKIDPPLPLEKALRLHHFDLQLVGSLQPGSMHIAESFLNGVQKIAAWVGPEGDFTAEEIRKIVEAGAKPVTLGPLVLRCETAAVYLLSVINHELTR